MTAPEASGDGGIQDDDAVGHGPHGVDEPASGCRLEQVARDTQLECLAHIGVVVVRAHDEDPAAKGTRGHPAGELEAAQARPADIYDGDIGIERAEENERLLAAAGLADGLEVCVLLEELHGPFAHQRMIVHDRHPDRGSRPGATSRCTAWPEGPWFGAVADRQVHACSLCPVRARTPRGSPPDRLQDATEDTA
jgi:hypothetical protein